MKAGEAEDRWDTSSGDTGRLRPEEGRKRLALPGWAKSRATRVKKTGNHAKFSHQLRPEHPGRCIAKPCQDLAAPDASDTKVKDTPYASQELRCEVRPWSLTNETQARHVI